MCPTTTASQPWRTALLECITKREYLTDKTADLSYALAIEANVRGILQESDPVFGIDLDQTALSSAALLHGVLPSYQNPPTRLQGIQGNRLDLDEAEHLLRGLLLFDSARIELILTLLAHCEDTIMLFPIRNLQNNPAVETIDSLRINGSIERHLGILREADACAHLSVKYLDNSILTWTEAGVTWLPNDREPLPTLMWHESIEGNIRLMVKRATIDCLTQSGKHQAMRGYERGEKLIHHHCTQVGANYLPELCPPSIRPTSLTRMSGKAFSLDVVEYLSEAELQRTLRTVAIKGDTSILPYQHARLRLVALRRAEVAPIATYVLTERLAETQELFDAFMSRYCFGLFDLAGLMKFRYNSKEVLIGPPLVETHLETPADRAVPANLLVDGLHRFVIATQNGLDRVWVLHAEQVPYPLIALPVTWDSVIECQQPPPSDLKRIYRFHRLADVPADVIGLVNGAINQHDFQDYFYRELEALGSKGRR